MQSRLGRQTRSIPLAVGPSSRSAFGVDPFRPSTIDSFAVEPSCCRHIDKSASHASSCLHQSASSGQAVKHGPVFSCCAL
uniref:Large S protein n=1 Tax=Hepatitis B virus TaxID=10407 RepID=D2X410_HBV|nr:large S protein [Hepatitis B virus]